MRHHHFARISRACFASVFLAVACLSAGVWCTATTAQDESSNEADRRADKNDADGAADEDAKSDREAGGAEKLQKLEVADGRLVFEVPRSWKKQQPSVRIVEIELSVPSDAGGADGKPNETTGESRPLEFRIVASQRDPAHARVLEAAQELSPSVKEVVIGEKKVARWVPYDVSEFEDVGEPDPVPDRAMIKRQGKGPRIADVPETLVLLDGFNVTDQHLETTSLVRSETGRPAVSFRLSERGAALFGQLTGGNLPDPATGRTKFLGILFHGKLSSAPSIRSQIGQEGIIEGNFTEEEVESLVQTLKSGQGRTATGESAPGRLTIMQAGGSVEANIDRWMAQFQQPDGKPSRDAAKIEEKEYDGLPVHLVDVAGTFVDRRGGPFNPNAQTVELENYRMLAAIIETKGGGNYFVKFTGPAETVEQNSAAFQRAIEMLQWE